MPLADLPHEIIAVVLRMVLDEAAVPSDVLCVCRRFYDLGTDHLYAHLWFTSAHQLHRFALADTTTFSPLPPRLPVVAPRTFAVDLTGKVQHHVLGRLRDALMKCRRLAIAGTSKEEGEEKVSAARGQMTTMHHGDVRLKCLRLRMHSYAREDAAVHALEEGLQAVSPDKFEWTGPDPDHHFSIAVVPPVAACLFKQFPSWRSIREITVTNISFATGTDLEGPSPPLMEDVPSLRSLYIGQAAFLHAQAVAGMLCQGRMARLDSIRLVDAYSGSIWGPRLRRSDIEKAVEMLCRKEERVAVITRVKKIVTCEKKTERIMGGDRVDGTHILD